MSCSYMGHGQAVCCIQNKAMGDGIGKILNTLRWLVTIINKNLDFCSDSQKLEHFPTQQLITVVRKSVSPVTEIHPVLKLTLTGPCRAQN